MATKVKPSRLNITWTPQAWDVPMYVDANNFQWWTGGSSVTVVDNLNSQSGTDALSANQWYILNNKIADLFGLGKFLSVWDATTWLPDSFPLTTPYTYSTWDYYLVWTVSSATPPVNYRPTWSSYTWTASSTPETDELEVWDIYIYDGSAWLLQSNHWKSVSFANLAWDAMDNANLSWYLNVKAFYLSSTSDLTTAQAAFEWQNGGKTAIVVYSNKPYAFSFYNTAQMDFVCLLYREQLDAGNNKTSLVRDVITLSVTWGTTVSSISANAWNNVIASVLKTDTDYTTPYTPQYNGSPATKKYVDDKVDDTAYASSWNWVTWIAPSKNAVYDKIESINGVPSWWNNWDVLTNVSGTPTWQAPSGWITKIFTLSSTSDLTTAQAAYDWHVGGGNPIVVLGNKIFTLQQSYTSEIRFSCVVALKGSADAISNGYIYSAYSIFFTISSWSVTAISEKAYQTRTLNTAPTSWTPNNVVTLVY